MVGVPILLCTLRRTSKTLNTLLKSTSIARPLTDRPAEELSPPERQETLSPQRAAGPTRDRTCLLHTGSRRSPCPRCRGVTWYYSVLRPNTRPLSHSPITVGFDQSSYCPHCFWLDMHFGEYSRSSPSRLRSPRSIRSVLENIGMRNAGV